MVKLLDLIKENEDFPKVLWHATAYDNLGKILHEGLKTRNEGVYFTDDPVNSAKFLYIRGIKHIIVIPVDLSKLDQKKLSESFDHSEAFFKTRAWIYSGDIAPNKINARKIMVYNL